MRLLQLSTIIGALLLTSSASANICKAPITLLEVKGNAEDFKESCKGEYWQDGNDHFCEDPGSGAFVAITYRNGVSVAAGIMFSPIRTEAAKSALALCLETYGARVEVSEGLAIWMLPQYRVTMTYDGETLVIRADRRGRDA